MTDFEQRELKRLEREFVQECSLGCGYIERARTSQPPRPPQHQFVLQWPAFGCMDELEDRYCFNAPQLSPFGLLLHGASGTGKTTSAYMAIKASLLRWSTELVVRSVVAIGAVELGRRISELARTGGDDFDQYLWDLQNTPLLFIDDFDKARFTPRVESELFALLEHRDVAQMPIVITTNLTGRELQKMFSPQIGPAIISRLRRMCIPVNFDEPEFDAEAAVAAIQARMRERYAAHGAQWGVDPISEQP
jgi:chromosomal replication initiation ATPase DnaA